MITSRLIATISLIWIVASAFGQADLQIVTPNCNQYSDLSVPCTACLCPRVYDGSEAPCNTLSFGTVEVGLTRTLSVIIANSAQSSAVTPNLQASVKLVQSGLADNTAQWEILSGAGTDLTPNG